MIRCSAPSAARALACLAVAASAAAGCPAARAQDTAGPSALPDTAPSVTPYRPSVSTPAALSAPGYLEFEAGGLAARGSGPQRRASLPYTVKLAFDPDWGVRIGGEAWAAQIDGQDRRSSGLGDSSVVVKRRFAIDDAQAFGLELGALAPTGASGVGGGSAGVLLNVIYSADVGPLHTDINLAATRFGSADAGMSRMQKLWAASLSGPLTQRWGLIGEFSGTAQGGAGSSSQLLFAATCNVSRRLVLDAGIARSLRGGGPDASVFIGLTALGPRLF